MVFAIKSIKKNNIPRNEHQRLFQEIQLLKSLDHPNIIKIYGFYQDVESFQIINEYCQGGELFKMIIREKKFNEEKASQITEQLLKAVYYCHNKNIIHRDIKPENILLDVENDIKRLKVIDFGTARFAEKSDVVRRKIGTAYYMAPEVLERKYNYKCDIWSIGVICYILLCGSPPYSGKSQDEILVNIQVGSKKLFQQMGWKTISQEAIEFVRKLLDRNPETRLDAQQALNDVWIKKYNNNVISESDSVICKSVFDNLVKYKKSNSLSNISWKYLVRMCSESQDLEQVKDIFNRIDSDKNGYISQKELVDAISQFHQELTREQAEEQVKQIFINSDENQSGQLYLTEFLVASIDRNSFLTDQKLEIAFNMLDQDGDGNITIKEFKEHFGNNIDDRLWHKLIKEVDQNDDGQINFQEFNSMMKSLY